MSLLEVTLLGFLAGTLGTALGGILSITLVKITPIKLSFLLGFSAGIMLSIVAFELMPEALDNGIILWGIIGLIIGSVLMAGIDIIFPHMHISGAEEQSPFIKTGVILGLGIAMHNLPEGLAIGIGGTQRTELGLALAVAIFSHNIPEGLALALPLNIGKVRIHRILLSTVAIGLPMGIGAFIGGVVGQISPPVVALSLSFAAGAMLYITCDELIPQAQKNSKGHSATFGIVSGIIAGILILSLVPH